MPRISRTAVARRARRIRCLFLDIDGVLTDGKLYLGNTGEEIKTSYVRDGLGMKMLMQAGVGVAIISGRPSPAMQKRLASLGITEIVLNNEDKLPVYEDIRKRLKLDHEECAAMGDDVPDLPVLRQVGLALTVADAHATALRAAHWVSRYPGGQGAVREACDLILAARGRT